MKAILKNKKQLLLASAISGLIVLVIGIFLFVRASTVLDFTYYEPSYVPPHTAILQKRIVVWRPEPSQDIVLRSAELNFRTEDWVYAIREWKHDGQAIPEARQNYDETSEKPTCSFYDTAKGQRFRLCHWVDYQAIDVHEVKFIKGTTFFDIQIPTKLTEKISVDELRKFVDSFEPKSTFGVPVKEITGV